MNLRNEFTQDNLNREKLAKDYTTFLNKLQGNHVIALDAPWGSGKSKFIDFMCSKFDENKDVYVKYNAWENDYTNEPLISLMSDVFRGFENKQYIGVDEMKGLVSKISNIGLKSLSAITKGATRIVLGEGGSEDATEAIKEIGRIFVDDNVDSLFKTIDESKKSRTEFKIQLDKYTKQILEEKTKTKLFIIIDELDRCKPTFAIELLESIKHLFDIEEIVFFIAVDRTQLAESIKSIYGQGFDSDTYLHRFFDMELHLPKINLEKHFEIILNHKFNNPEAYNDYKCNTYITSAIHTLDLTIRDFERITSETILLKTINVLKGDEFEICILLLILKYKKPDVYDIIFKNDTNDFTSLNVKILEIKNSEKLNIFIISCRDILMFQQHMNSWYFKDATKKLLNIIKNTL